MIYKGIEDINTTLTTCAVFKNHACERLNRGKER